MKHIERADAKRSLAVYARQAEKETLIVTVRRKFRVAVVRLDGDTDWEAMSLSTNPEFMAIVQASRNSLKKHGGISSDQLRRRLGIAKRGARPART
jgi:hypothetical protein